jgi:hypothetical protein
MGIRRHLRPAVLYVVYTVYAIFAAGLFLSLGHSLQGCSLSLESPEEEARKKLATLVPPTLDLLEGRWVGDSTYTIFDLRATPLGRGLVMDVFPDSTLHARDTGRLVFPGRYDARLSLSMDTLRLRPGPGKGQPDTFTVKLRFLGNWLELDRAGDRRFVHLHKEKPFDPATRKALLDSGLWIKQRTRLAMDSMRHEPLRRDFEYLRFGGDSLRRDIRRNGIGELLSGPLEPSGNRWRWTPGGSDRILHVDLFHADTLRVWYFAGGRPDSGFAVYSRRSGRHPGDLDVAPLLGHLRGDTLRTNEGPGKPTVTTALHYGRFYDLVLRDDHTVSTRTNMPEMPLYASWALDSGQLVLARESATARFTVAALPGGRTALVSAGGGFLKDAAELTLTPIDGSRLADHPLERFERASYLHLETGGDTLAYYFANASNRKSPEEHEIARVEGADTLWAIWRLDASRDTYASSQAGFLLAFQGRNAAMGRFTCRSAPELDLALRASLAADPELAQGTVQGSCRIASAEKSPADSVLPVTGTFRSRRKGAAVASPLWKQP